MNLNKTKVMCKEDPLPPITIKNHRIWNVDNYINLLNKDCANRIRPARFIAEDG